MLSGLKLCTVVVFNVNTTGQHCLFHQGPCSLLHVLQSVVNRRRREPRGELQSEGAEPSDQRNTTLAGDLEHWANADDSRLSKPKSQQIQDPDSSAFEKKQKMEYAAEASAGRELSPNNSFHTL